MDISPTLFNFGSSFSRGSSKQRAALRWQKAFTVIYSCRVMLSFADKIVSHSKEEILSAISCSPSYTITTLHVQSQDADGSNVNETGKHGGFFFQVDQEAVGKVVREKDMESLQQLGEIQVIAAEDIYVTDAERGIHGNAEDFNGRKEVLLLTLFFVA